MVDWMLLTLAGFVAFLISTVAGGGGSLILVPIVGFYLGVQAEGLASHVGKRILGQISSRTFRILVIGLMVISGAVMVYRQISGWF